MRGEASQTEPPLALVAEWGPRERWSPPPPAPAPLPPPPHQPAAAVHYTPQPPHGTEPLDEVLVANTHYHWSGPDPTKVGLKGCICSVCQESFLEEEGLKTHVHQFHLNPHHLSPHDIHRYRLSNFLVRSYEESEDNQKTDFPGLYRCHECFQVFDQPGNLTIHLEQHIESSPNKLKMVAAPPEKIPIKMDKLPREDFEDVKPQAKKRRTSSTKPLKTIQKQKKRLTKKSRSSVRNNKLLKLEPVVADEMVSEESDSGTEAPKGRPKRECGSRTSTLVAISLAEQEYEQFDLDFGRFKTDVNTISEVDIARMKHATKRVLFDRDNIPVDNSEEDVDVPSDEINLVNRRSLSPSDSFSDSKSSSKEAKNGRKKTDRKKIVLKKLPKAKFEKKRRKIRKSALGAIRKSLLSDELNSEEEDSSTKENDLFNELNLVAEGPERKSRGGKPEGSLSGLKGAVQEKARQVVHEVLAPPPTFICLHCHDHFSEYAFLKNHKKLCKPQTLEIYKDSEGALPEKKEVKEEGNTDLYEYVTGSVMDIPETTFNNMHGKINDLKTTDATKFAAQQLNEIGLVKLNYSGPWSVGEVWESAGWEPREDQLSWQQYEVAAADGQDTRERQGRQGLGRRAPLITDRATSRAFLVKLSTLPWSEQRKIKEKMDQALDVKKARKTEKPADHSIRQSVLPNQLELRQVGRSVKYMKAVEREAVKEAEEVGREEVVRGTLSGEWEHEFSFVCSVCAIEYDDVLEIMHHKWEAHPHCLVTHVSLKEGTVRPPALLYPQVGPSMVYPFPPDPRPPAPQWCSKCSASFPPHPDPNSSYHAHLLVCGGVTEWDPASSIKKRKQRRWRGKGGGLKRTVRMIQKSQSLEGTDTDGESPRKRVRPPPRPPRLVEPVPKVPTHNRTTRFKETRKKEARNEAAKKRRTDTKTSKNRTVKHVPEKKVSTPNSIRKKLVLKADSDPKKAGAITKIKVEEKRQSRGSSSSRSSSSSSSVSISKRPRRSTLLKTDNVVKNPVKRATALRPRQLNRYKEESSESDSDSRSSIEDLVDPMEIMEGNWDVPINILETVAEIIDRVVEVSRTPKKRVRSVGTPPIQTPTKAVPVRIEDDLKIVLVNDLDKPLMVRQTTETNDSSKSSVSITIPSSPRKKRDEEAPTIKTPVTPPKSIVEEIEASPLRSSEAMLSEKKGVRSLKRLESDLVVVADLSPVKKRRNSFEVASFKATQPLRINLPLEVKLSAIERVEGGESLAVVSRDLDITITSLSAWLMRKAEIRVRWQQAQEAVQTEALPPATKSTGQEANEDNLINQLLESSDNESETSVRSSSPKLPTEINEMASLLGLRRISKPETEEELGITEKSSNIAASDTTTLSTVGSIKKADCEDAVANTLDSTSVAECARKEDCSRNQTSSFELKKAVDTDNIDGFQKEGSAKSDLPLSDLFKSMKTAFTTNGEVKSKMEVRKKSLEFLSNSLMKKAVAKSLSPPKVSAKEHIATTTASTPVEHTPPSTATAASLFVKPCSHPTPSPAPMATSTPTPQSTLATGTSSSTLPTIPAPSRTSATPRQYQVGMSAILAQARPQSGLAMIGSSYCSSSDDEL